MSANALVKGLYFTYIKLWVQYAWDYIIFAYSATPGATRENIVDDAYSAIFFAGQFEEISQEIIAQDALKEILGRMYDLSQDSLGTYDLKTEMQQVIPDTDFIQGIYCWLCENGAYEVTRIFDLENAIFQRYPTNIPLYYWGQFIKLFMLHHLKNVQYVHSQYLFNNNCDESQCEGCGEWDLALNQWSYQIDLNISQESWLPATADGTFKSMYTAGEGMQPDLTTPPGSGNWSCIQMFIQPGSAKYRTLSVGLAAGYPVDGHFRVTARRTDDATTAIIQEFDFPSGQDFFGAVFDDTIEYDRVTVMIYRQDGECYDSVIPTPTIRYTIFEGVKPSPFP